MFDFAIYLFLTKAGGVIGQGNDLRRPKRYLRTSVTSRTFLDQYVRG